MLVRRTNTRLGAGVVCDRIVGVLEQLVDDAPATTWPLALGRRLPVDESVWRGDRQVLVADGADQVARIIWRRACERRASCRELDVATGAVDRAIVSSELHSVIEQPRAVDEDSEALGAGDRDVEAVRVEEEVDPRGTSSPAEQVIA